jgi:hypothetical protein
MIRPLRWPGVANEPLKRPQAKLRDAWMPCIITSSSVHAEEEALRYYNGKKKIGHELLRSTYY